MAINTANIKFFESTNSVSAINSLGGAITATELTAGLNGLFDQISSAESTAGDTEYRCIYVQNKSFGTGAEENDLISPALALITDATDPDTSIHFSIQDAVNVTAGTIANEDTAPAGAVWVTIGGGAQAFSADLTFAGNTNAGDFQAIWIRRTVINTTVAAATDSCTFSLTGETAA